LGVFSSCWWGGGQSGACIISRVEGESKKGNRGSSRLGAGPGAEAEEKSCWSWLTIVVVDGDCWGVILGAEAEDFTADVEEGLRVGVLEGGESWLTAPSSCCWFTTAGDDSWPIFALEEGGRFAGSVEESCWLTIAGVRIAGGDGVEEEEDSCWLMAFTSSILSVLRTRSSIINSSEIPRGNSNDDISSNVMLQMALQTFVSPHFMLSSCRWMFAAVSHNCP